MLILGGARFLTSSSDAIARRTGLGHTFAGMLLLATATSLPELGTGISSITIQDAPDLAAGAAFGSNLVNILIIGLIDFAYRTGPILGHVPKGSLVGCATAAGVIAVASLAVFIHHQTTAMSGWYISPLTVALFALFVFSAYSVYRSEQGGDVQGEDQAGDGQEPPPLRRSVAIYAAAALVVICCAVWLSFVGDQLAEALNWEKSFVGTQFLAISTSLPEMATCFAAVRIGAPALAVGNLLGSNLFNMGFILSANELAFTDGAVWAAISPVHSVTGLIAIGMTALVAAALVIRSRRPRSSASPFRRPEAFILIVAYIGASVGLYYAG